MLAKNNSVTVLDNRTSLILLLIKVYYIEEIVGDAGKNCTRGNWIFNVVILMIIMLYISKVRSEVMAFGCGSSRLLS